MRDMNEWSRWIDGWYSVDRWYNKLDTGLCWDTSGQGKEGRKEGAGEEGRAKRRIKRVSQRKGRNNTGTGNTVAALEYSLGRRIG